MLLPELTRFSIRAAKPRYASCARVMEWASAQDSDAVAYKRLVENLVTLNADLKVPSPSSLGHGACFDVFDMMAAQALASGSAAKQPACTNTSRNRGALSQNLVARGRPLRAHQCDNRCGENAR